MKSNRTLFRKAATILIGALLSVSGALAQKPEITTVDKVNGSMKEVVTLKGSSFGIDSTKLAVFFGAQKASIKSITNQLLEVAIPPGTTYNNISVANTTAGLTGYSRNQFLLSFSGRHPFDISNLGVQQDFAANSELYDHCLCDLNLDGKVDIATANKSSTSVSILRNTSTGPGNINFNTTQFPIGAPSLQIKCGDLNSDGRPDLVVTEGTSGVNDRVFILQNTGAFTFSTQIIKLTGRKNSKIEIADLDLNGKPEVIITDLGSGTVSILINQSAGAIAFAPAPLELIIANNSTAAATTDAIAVEDLNGDDRPDLVTSQFGTSNSNLYIAPNTSVPGTISFGAISMITVGGGVRDVRIGDLDNDGKPDLALTQFLTGTASVLLNTSAGSAISFGTITPFPTDAAPFGLDFGDIDGDGLTDIAVASLATSNVTLLNNQSTPGNLSFLRQSAATTFITRHVRVGDLDGDGKPDISFCSVDKSGTPASKVSVFRNSKACVLPKLSPTETPLSLCTGTLPYKLTATLSRGAYYKWFKDGGEIACGLNMNTLDVTAVTGSGTYTVKILSEGGTCAATGACEEESEGIDITIGAGAAVTVLPTNNGPVCIGSTLTLGVTNNTGTSYKWTGPANFTGTGPSPTRTDFKLEYAGTYTVEVTAGGCIASRESTVVEAIDAPTFSVSYGTSTVFCSGTKTLSVVPNPATYDYQWLKDGNPIPAADDDTYSVTPAAASTGNYSVRASYSGCNTIETTPVEIRFATPPSAVFTMAPVPACAGQKVTFDNQSTFDNIATVSYFWDFDDGQTSTAAEPEHIFATANPYSVELTVSYSGNVCSNTTSNPITITNAPPVAITNPSNDYLMCEGEELSLEVTGTFTTYAWSTGETGPSIIITQSGTYTVDVKATNGCLLTASRVVNGLPAPGVIVTATPQQINEGESSQLLASGLNNYEWIPPDGLSSTTIAEPVATPLVTTTYTVTGEDTNGCTGTATIEVSVKGDAIVSKLDPKNFFSPNNSGPNDLWTVDHILEYPQCTVTIYDDKGVKVFNAKPYQNDWNGIFNGKPLPDGVYFYIIRCDGEENSPRTGSITLIR